MAVAVRRTSIVVVRSTRIVAGIKAVVAVRGLFAELLRADEDILHYYPLAKMQQKWAKSGPVVVERRPCKPNNLTLLSLGGGSHLKRESHPSPFRLVF